MFRMFWFWTMHAGWVQNKTHETSTSERMISGVCQLQMHTGISSHLGAKLHDWANTQAEAFCYPWAALSSKDSKTQYKGRTLVDFVSEWSLLLVVELLAGGAVVGGGVLEELVEEGHLAAGTPLPRVVAPHWKNRSVLSLADETMMYEGFKNVSIG